MKRRGHLANQGSRLSKANKSFKTSKSSKAIYDEIVEKKRRKREKQKQKKKKQIVGNDTRAVLFSRVLSRVPKRELVSERTELSFSEQSTHQSNDKKTSGAVLIGEKCAWLDWLSVHALERSR